MNDLIAAAEHTFRSLSNTGEGAGAVYLLCLPESNHQRRDSGMQWRIHDEKQFSQ